MASACATTEAPTPTIRLLTHEGLVIPQESIDAYTASTGVRVAILREPSPAAVVELLSRTREQPVADVVLGIDSLSLPRVVAEGLVTPYRAIEADRLDPNLMVDDNRVTPVSTIDVCLNVDADFYRPEPPSEEELAEQALREAALPEGAELAVPEPVDDTGPQQPSTILDLTRADHADELVIPDPVTDRMGQYFLVALWQKFGSDTSAEQNWQTVARNLLANGALVAPSWTDAYFGEFTQGNAEGERRVTLASAGMPEVTARLRFELPELLETEVINDGCLRVVNYAGIVQGIEARRDAGRLIDTIISPEFQFYLGDDRGSRPARADLIIPELVEQFGTEVDAAAVSPAVDDELIGELVLQWQQLLVENNSAPEQPLGVENP
jgi:thiamine transport system substrate-binding protein